MYLFCINLNIVEYKSRPSRENNTKEECINLNIVEYKYLQ